MRLTPGFTPSGRKQFGRQAFRRRGCDEVATNNVGWKNVFRQKDVALKSWSELLFFSFSLSPVNRPRTEPPS
jgi:hypothetical protein